MSARDTTDLLVRVLGPRLGHIPPVWPQRIHDLVERLAAAKGLESAIWLSRLATCSPPNAELDALVDIATVGHTTFFRHPEQFSELRRILRTSFERRQTKLKVWSAGCSTGEEAYSIALTAEEVCVPVEILATDVNPIAVQSARTGLFIGNRMSRLPNDVSVWTAPPKISSMIRFEVASLVDDEPALGEGPFDLVLCRNVLIYFAREVAIEILEILAQRMRLDCVLLVSPVDAVLPIPPCFVRGDTPGVLRLSGRTSSSSARPASLRMSNFVDPGGLGSCCLQPPLPEAPLVEQAARLLGSGQGLDAEQILTSTLDAEPDNIGAWFLLGEALLLRGEGAQARAAFARASRCTPRESAGIDGEALRMASARRAETIA